MITYSDPCLKSCSDEMLISLIKDKNESAFEVLTSRYIGLISSIASRYRNIQTSATYDFDDFIQEGLLGLFYAGKNYDKNKESSFKNFAVICIENRYRSVLRKINSKNQIPINSITAIDDRSNDYVDMTQQGLEEIIESKEYIKALQNRMRNELSSFEYDVLSLRLSGMSRKDIAAKYAKSEKSVDNAIQRAYKKLRD